MLEYKNTMLVSPKKVKEYGNINLNVDEAEMGAAIRIAQDVHLKDAVGRNLIEHVQELVYNKIQGSGSTIDDDSNEPYKVLLDEYLIPALVYRTAMELCTILTLKVRNMGLVKNSDTNVNATDGPDMSYMQEYYGVLYNDALNRIMDYLCENKGAIPEVPDGFCTCSSKPRFAQTGLWLGPHKKHF